MQISSHRDTICSLATPVGHSALAVIRISGPDSYRLIEALSPKSKAPKSFSSPKVKLLDLMDFAGNQLDQVLVTFFPEGKSFTGECSAEISCHGNPFLIEKILFELSRHGCRQARRGEFSSRAFLNDKLDLIQAEGILSLIHSENAWAHQQSLRSLSGKQSEEFLKIEDQLVYVLAQIEASLDFREEINESDFDQDMRRRIESLKSNLKQLADSYQTGNVLFHGLTLSLAGRPNVGKSSLLNFLIQDEKAIVSEIAGTTRDMVEGETRYGSTSFRFVDTAGLRGTDDPIEMIGVAKSFEQHKKSDRILFVFESQIGWNAADQKILDGLPLEKIVFVGTKMDLVEDRTQVSLPPCDRELSFLMSTFDHEKRRELMDWIAKPFVESATNDRTLISNPRHAELCLKSAKALDETLNILESGGAVEFQAVFLREALFSIQEILGKRFDDQILDRVFKEFCLGK